MNDDLILSTWERLLQPDGHPMPPEVARYVQRLALPPGLRDRITELAGRANDGTLTGDERDEQEAYCHAAAFLTVLQSKARIALRGSTPVSGNGVAAS